MQLSALQADYDNLNARFEEESEAASVLRQQLSKSTTEYQSLKARFDKEVIHLTEELEDTRYTSLPGVT